MKLRFRRINSSLLYKIIIPSSIGNVLEFYDFATYGFLMPIMAPLFFPSKTPIISLLLASGAFAISFLARPLGGMIFGYIGDKYGGKFSFSLSLIIMAIATSSIGILPTFGQIGILSPLLLIGCRLLQGLCMGGEFSSSLIFTVEHINNKINRSSFITSSITAAGVSGWFLSSVICSLSLTFSLTYSWRIPFLLGGIVGGIGYYLRRINLRSPILASDSSSINKNIFEVVMIEWKSILSIIGIGILMGGFFYGIHIFPNSFLPIYFSHISQEAVLHYTTIGIATYMIFLPLMGWFADTIGHSKLMLIFSFLTLILSYPIIILLMSGLKIFIISAEVLSAILLAGFMAPATFLMTQLFERSFKYRLVSINYNLGASISGGLAPLTFLFLIEYSLHAPALYLIVCSIFGLFTSYHLFKIMKKD